jgi:arginine N-succinyltransferase
VNEGKNDMYIIRPIGFDDFGPYCHMAFKSHLAMTSMPKNEELLKNNIFSSLDAFSSSGSSLKNKFYLFVLENFETKEIGGTSGIYSQVGIDTPYYHYRKEVLHQQGYEDLPIKNELPILKAVAITNGPSEVCSLYISPHFRKEGLGRLLSLSRFLFIACFLEKFHEILIAQMRGCVDQDNVTAFWDNLGRHFIDLSYAKVQQIKATNPKFLPHILPKNPIYIDLLPKEVQALIGKVHDNTRPALKILQEEGFEMTQDYDVFDGGPIIKATTKSIRAIKDYSKKFVESITNQLIDSEKYIVSNSKLAFRCCYSSLSFTKDSGITIPQITADALALKIGDPIQFVLAYPTKK